CTPITITAKGSSRKSIVALGANEIRMQGGSANSPTNSPLCHRNSIVEIPLALAQQKQVLMCLRRPIRHRLRHRVRLGPDDVGPQIPSIRLQRERDTPRDATEILGFK